MRKHVSLCVLALCACVSIGLSSCGQTVPADGAAERTGDSEQPKPDEVLRRMAEYLEGLTAFSYRAHLEIEIQGGQAQRLLVTEAVVRVEKPNRIASIIQQGELGMTLVSDGDQLAVLLPTLNRYVVRDAPPSLAVLREQTGISGIGLFGIAGDVVPASEAQYEKLMDEVTESRYVGREEVAGIPCHRLRFAESTLSWDIWIEAGARPVVHRVTPDISKQLAPSAGDGKAPPVKYTITYTDWDVSPRFTASEFSFTPPPGAEQVESLYEDADAGPHPLVGQPAPPFTTVDLEGRPIDLRKHLGKQMILLDFWATWCKPCVVAMPDVDAVAEQYADQGLVFYAVNLGQDAATAKEFLAEAKLDVPVAMDPDTTIGGLYHVEGIPQTVLIGKDGRVQVVHVGFSSALGDMLRQNIEDLLAGKDLAGQARAESNTPAEKDGEE